MKKKKPAQFPTAWIADCGFILAWWSRLFLPDQGAGHAAHVTCVVAEPSYRSLLTAARHRLTAWLTRAWRYPVALPRTKHAARNEIMAHFVF